ncbi:MAG: DUF2254 family protein [Bacteroidota bacterium]
MKSNFFADSLKILAGLIIFSLLFYILNRFVDYLIIANGITFFSHLYDQDIGNLTNTVGSLGEVVTGVFGVELTAVTIIVQLAANKYSDSVMVLFIRNKINAVVYALFVIVAINTLLVTNTIKEDFVSHFSITVNLSLIIVTIIIIIPHLSYVFNFLRPENFLSYVKDNITKTILSLETSDSKTVIKARQEVFKEINFIGDIATNSVHQGDRATTLLCITVLREILLLYLPLKSKIPKDWFHTREEDSMDPDFASYSQFVLQRIDERQIILERKVFQVYDLIYNNSRSTLREVASGVLLNSQLIGCASAAARDEGALENVFKYFNSYLRFAINGKDPRSAFNTLEHYRVLAEELLRVDPKVVEEVSFYFKYYGQEANKRGVLFIIETAAHDLCRINELAFDLKVPNTKELLGLFLKLDEPLKEGGNEELTTQEISLIGVRIAQVKLAGYYLFHGNEELAKVIYNDMKVEPVSRIQHIKDIIFNTTQEEFWEITPRGVNFYYVSPRRREALVQFFNWFEQNNVS